MTYSTGAAAGGLGVLAALDPFLTGSAGWMLLERDGACGRERIWASRTVALLPTTRLPYRHNSDAAAQAPYPAIQLTDVVVAQQLDA